MRNLISIALVFLIPYLSRAEGWQTEGEIDVLTKVGSKPTSERGQVSFSVPSLKLATEFQLDSNASVYFQGQLAESRGKDTKKQQFDLVRAFYEWGSDDDTWLVRYGLIKSTYLDTNENLLDYDLVPEFKAFANRYNYLPDADIGFEIHYVVSSYLDFSLGVFNGEENTQKEAGPEKDIYLTVVYDDSSFHFSALSIRGAYDEYEKPFNVKERDLARIVWKASYVDIGFEALKSKELSMAAVAYKRGESWDGSLYPETVVKAQGFSGWLLLKVDSELQFLLRKDYLDPYTEVKEDEIESENVALILKDNLRSLLIGYTKTDYKERHSTQSPEREYAFVGLRQIF